jgi:hypothetical protein
MMYQISLYIAQQEPALKQGSCFWSRGATTLRRKQKCICARAAQRITPSPHPFSFARSDVAADKSFNPVLPKPRLRKRK